MYILTLTNNELEALDTTYLSAYVLSDVDVQLIEKLKSDKTTLTADLHAELMSKVGPASISKQSLNSMYVANNNKFGYSDRDLQHFKNFVKHDLVGHKPVNIEALHTSETSE